MGMSKIEKVLGNMPAFKYGFGEADPALLVVQTPEEFEKTRVGMCHDATAWLSKRLKARGVNHICIYLESGKKPCLPTHSFVVARFEGKYRVLDIFGVEGCVYPVVFSSFGDAVYDYASKWVRDEGLADDPLYVRSTVDFPSGIDIISFMKKMHP